MRRVQVSQSARAIGSVLVLLLLLVVSLSLSACMTGEAVSAFNRGNEYMKQEEYGMAVYEYSVVISINPEYVRAFNNRGIAYTERGNYDEAISDFTRVLELDPQYIAAYNNRGIAHYKKGDVEQAIADFEKTLELTDDPALRQQAEQALEEVRP